MAKIIKKNYSQSISFASFGMALSIMLGAFGAHYLDTKLSDTDKSVFETAVQYQVYSCLGILLLCLLANSNNINLNKPMGLLLTGMTIFCGSLYFLSLRSVFEIEGVAWIGAFTPIGGLCMIGAWLWTGMVFYRLKSTSSL